MAGSFDALIVDEGQDVSADWWLPLQILLVDPDRSPLYVFFDDNQKLFPVPTGLPFLHAPVQLTVNCRNTRRINELVMRFYKGGTIEAPGPRVRPSTATSTRGRQSSLPSSTRRLRNGSASRRSRPTTSRS
jgi:hypothetical protein